MLEPFSLMMGGNQSITELHLKGRNYFAVSTKGLRSFLEVCKELVNKLQHLVVAR